MRLDEASWRRVLAGLPQPDPAPAEVMVAAFVSAEDFAAGRGAAWLWRPGDASRRVLSADYAGRPAADWGMLLVVSEGAIDALCGAGEPSFARLVRRGEIRPFLLRSLQAYAAAGLADFVDALGLAFPRH